MAIGLTVEFTIGEGQNDAFEAFMAGATAKVKAEDSGCNNYDLFRSVEDDTKYLLFENWGDRGRPDRPRHLGSDGRHGRNSRVHHRATGPAPLRGA